MLDRGYYLAQPQAFAGAECTALRQAILTSPFLGKNPLNQYFATTLGFSVVFHREALDEVCRRFPAFTVYLKRALSPLANTFYLNPLVLPPGAHVMRHADFSLRSYDPATEPPAFVSVLYVDLPADLQGGELRLFLADDSCLATISPQAGTLLLFRGDLRHEVTTVTASADRISLVCEQYCLSPAAQARIPRFTVQSSASFAAMLALETETDS